MFQMEQRKSTELDVFVVEAGVEAGIKDGVFDGGLLLHTWSEQEDTPETTTPTSYVEMKGLQALKEHHPLLFTLIFNLIIGIVVVFLH